MDLRLASGIGVRIRDQVAMSINVPRITVRMFMIKIAIAVVDSVENIAVICWRCRQVMM